MVMLRQPSVRAPNRRRRLQTLSERKINKSRVTQLEKDKKLIISAMKRKMQFSRRTGRPVDRPGEQLVEIPLAIADNNGNPLKGQKSYTTYLESRYKQANVFFTELPFQPECSILEGMFLINTTPLGSHKCMSDYGRFLFTRFIRSQFGRGCSEVHVIFDNPGRQPSTPKYFEHMRRDTSAVLSIDHHCGPMNNTTVVPKQWREDLLNCRDCKRNLVKYLTQYFLLHGHTHMHENETLYVAGGFDEPITDTAWYTRVEEGRGVKQPDPAYKCNAEETDTRIWLHVKNTAYKRILVVSPDTDIYHIGLPLQRLCKEVVVQVSPINSRELKYLHMTALSKALLNDPDLAHIEPRELFQVFQTLYVCSGCDYTSFFHQIGKATFLRHFFQHANFITGKDIEGKGTLAEIGNEYQKGFLAFLRLIGSVYFKKHATCFETPTPASHFAKFVTATCTRTEQHNRLRIFGKQLDLRQ